MISYFREVTGLLTAALILITSMAWNDVTLKWIAEQDIFRNKVIGQLFYAIVMTIVTALVLVLIRRHRVKVPSSKYRGMGASQEGALEI